MDLYYILIGFSVITVSSAITGEYCQGQTFKPQCDETDEVIVVEKATYGRTVGRCVTRDYGYSNCSSSQLPVLDKLCSGTASCSIVVSDDILTEPLGCEIPKDFSRTLYVTYKCVKVLRYLPPDTSSNEFYTYWNSTNNLTTQCGNRTNPLIVKAQKGQIVNVSMINFENITDPSKIFGSIYINSTNNVISITKSARREYVLLISNGSTISVTITEYGNFMLIFKAIGDVSHDNDCIETNETNDDLPNVCVLHLGDVGKSKKPSTCEHDEDGNQTGSKSAGINTLTIILIVVGICVVVCILLVAWCCRREKFYGLKIWFKKYCCCKCSCCKCKTLNKSINTKTSVKCDTKTSAVICTDIDEEANISSATPLKNYSGDYVNVHDYDDVNKDIEDNYQEVRNVDAGGVNDHNRQKQAMKPAIRNKPPQKYSMPPPPATPAKPPPATPAKPPRSEDVANQHSVEVEYSVVDTSNKRKNLAKTGTTGAHGNGSSGDRNTYIDKDGMVVNSDYQSV